MDEGSRQAGHAQVNVLVLASCSCSCSRVQAEERSERAYLQTAKNAARDRADLTGRPARAHCRALRAGEGWQEAERSGRVDLTTKRGGQATPTHACTQPRTTRHHSPLPPRLMTILDSFSTFRLHLTRLSYRLFLILKPRGAHVTRAITASREVTCTCMQTTSHLSRPFSATSTPHHHPGLI